jgi:demethylmenaquinone methyltransferase/2-methoxy-6-polyprenyl-1,4-benzoquinol methylase
MPAQQRADPEARTGRLEAGQVRAMFDRIAGVYDLLNTVMTAGLHHRWRSRAVDLARVGPGSRVLDIATGTGDLAIELLRRCSPGGEVIGSDFSEGMLARARAKGADALAGITLESSGAASDNAVSARNGSFSSEPTHTGPAGLRFEWGDGLELPYPDGSFDAATNGFGLRNFSDVQLGLREMARVVRPGGRVVVLELTTPTRLPLSLFYRVWFDRVVPALGKATSPLVVLAGRGSRSGASRGESSIAQAYTYLPSSVKRFHSPAALAREMERAGLCEIGYVLMAGGIIAVHGATVPAMEHGEEKGLGASPDVRP